MDIRYIINNRFYQLVNEAVQIDEDQIIAAVDAYADQNRLYNEIDELIEESLTEAVGSYIEQKLNDTISEAVQAAVDDLIG